MVYRPPPPWQKISRTPMSVCILRVKFGAVFEAGLKADRAILSYIFFQYYAVRSDDVILLKSR